MNGVTVNDSDLGYSLSIEKPKAQTENGAAATCQVSAHKGAPDRSLSHRTVSVPESSERCSPRALYYIDSDLERQAVLDQLREEGRTKAADRQQVFYISSPSAVEDQGLLHTLIASDGKIIKKNDRLFGSDPLTVAIDLTMMSAAQAASLNELLDTPPRFRGCPIGKHVRLVVLMDGQTGHIVGSDCWRRLKLYTPQTVDSSALAAAKDNDTLLRQRIPPCDGPGAGDRAIEFFTEEDWREKLFGGFRLDRHGEVAYVDGALSRLEPGRSLILKDAPWDDDRFANTLGAAVREGGFESNGRWVSLPGDAALFRTTTSAEVIEARISRHCSKADLTNTYALVGRNNIHILSRTTVLNDDGRCVSYNPLEELAKGCRQIVINDGLTDAELRLLLHRFEGIHPSNRPRLVDNRPKSFKDGKALKFGLLPRLTTSIHTCADVMMTMGENWDELFQTVTLKDKEKHLFKVQDTPLLTQLKSFNDTVKIGINDQKIFGNTPKHSENAKRFSSVEENPPYLMVHGRKIIIPEKTLVLPPPGYLSRTRFWNNPVCNEPDSLSHSLFRLDRLFSAENATLKMVSAKSHSVSELKKLSLFSALYKKPSIMGKPDISSDPLLRLYGKRFQHSPHLYGYIKTHVKMHTPYPPSHAWFDPNDRKALLSHAGETFFGQAVLTAKADKDGLQRWFHDHPAAEKNDILRDFWLLAQHLPWQAFAVSDYIRSIHSKIAEAPDEECLNIVGEYLVGAIDDPNEQQAQADRIGVDLSTSRQLKYYRGERIKLIRQWIIAQQLDIQGNPKIFETLDGVFHILDNDTLCSNDKERWIKVILEEIQGDVLPPGFQDLPQALVGGEKHSPSRQAVRMAKLAEDVMSYPMIFLEGESGTGKTWMAQAVASMIFADTKRPNPASVKITIGPNTSYEDLYGRQVLKTRADGSQFTVFEDGLVLRWAKSRNPPLLILDEANLGRKNLLGPFKEMIEDSPALWLGSRKYPLTHRHRVIMTGNSSHYQGRTFDDRLKECMHVINYRAMDPQLLMRSVIYPSLPASWNNVQKSYACAVILSQLKRYGSMLFEEVLSPRDVSDLLASIRHTLRYALGAGNCVITNKKINALVQRAFEQCIDHGLDESHQPALAALKQWRERCFPVDNAILKGVDNSFAAFMGGLKKNRPDVDFDTRATSDLVRQYWLMLDKEDSRRGVIVEGPAGCGKDFILGCVFHEWNRQHPNQRIHYQHLNANLNDWDHLTSVVRKAMKEGSTVVISELNVIPSAYLEGLFNGLLTGDAAPGFRLVATVNPAEFSGRETFSPALKNRCTQIKLQPLHTRDIQGVIRRMASPQLAQWLTGRFVALASLLKEHKLPTQPSMADLFQLVPDMSCSHESLWGTLFERHFALEMRQAQITMSDLSAALAGETDPGQQPVSNDQSTREPLNLTKASGLPQYFLTMRTAGQRALYHADLGMPDQVYAPRKEGASYYPKPSSRRDAKVSKGTAARGSFSGRPDSAESFTVDFSTRKRLQLDRHTSGRSATVARRIFSSAFYPENSYRSALYRMNPDQFWIQDLVDPLSQGFIHQTIPEQVVGLSVLSCVPGSYSCSINNEWQPMPGLTPGDALKGIRCREGWALDVARSRATGQWLVRCATPMIQSAEKVTIDFMVKPDPAYDLPPEESPFVLDDHLISQVTRMWCDDHIFDTTAQSEDCASFAELRRIKAIRPVAAQLTALVDWCKSFGTTKSSHGVKSELVLDIIRYKQGVCRHRSMVFSLLASYFGIPTRVVRNDCHQYVEYSPNGGMDWHRLDLGGGRGRVTSLFGDFSGHGLASRMVTSIASAGQFLFGALRHIRGRPSNNHNSANSRGVTHQASVPDDASSVSDQPGFAPSHSNEQAKPKVLTSEDDQNTEQVRITEAATDLPQHPPHHMRQRHHVVQQWLEHALPVAGPEQQPLDRMEDDSHNLSRMLVAIETRGTVSEQQAQRLRTCLDRLSTATTAEKRYAYQRILPFLSSTSFALLLKDHPDWIVLLEATLTMNNDSPESAALNRINRLMVVERLSRYAFFARSSLAEQLCQHLEDSGEYSTDELLAFFERADTDSTRQKRNAFYQALRDVQKWPCNDDANQCDISRTISRSQSKIVKRLLRQPGTTTDWQHTYAGGGLSVTRLMTGEACFRKTVEGGHQQTKAAWIHLDPSLFHHLKQAALLWKNSKVLKRQDSAQPVNPLSGGCGSEDIDRQSTTVPQVEEKAMDRANQPVEQLMVSFFKWLEHQDTSGQGGWLITQSNDAKGEPPPLVSGRYCGSPDVWHIKVLLKDEQSCKKNIVLDQKLVRKAVQDASAVLIQGSTIVNIFREWLAVQTL